MYIHPATEFFSFWIFDSFYSMKSECMCMFTWYIHHSFGLYRCCWDQNPLTTIVCISSHQVHSFFIQQLRRRLLLCRNLNVVNLNPNCSVVLNKQTKKSFVVIHSLCLCVLGLVYKSDDDNQIIHHLFFIFGFIHCKQQQQQQNDPSSTNKKP